MADRKLPDWMSDGMKDTGTEHSKTLPRFHKKNILEDSLPYLEFAGSVVYSYEANDCSFLSEDLRTCLVPGSAVGFDIEWPPSFISGKVKKVAMLQLCPSEEKCYLFHLSSMSGFPSGLKRLLEDQTIKKVGVGIEGDMWKLMSDFDIKLKNFVELADLANKRLRCVERWSLDGLVKHLFNKQLLKDRAVRCGHWDDFILTEDQKRYAATDAYAGFVIYKKLETMDPAGGETSGLDVKERLLQISSEMQDLAQQIPHQTSGAANSAAALVDGLAQGLGALRSLLLGGRSQIVKDEETSPQRTREDSRPPAENEQPGGAAGGAPGRPSSQDPDRLDVDLFNDSAAAPDKEPQDVPPAPRECIMSLDISEYELQVIERQAMREAFEEESILAHQATVGTDEGSDLSYVVESDEELENEMLQCVDELDRLNSSSEDLQSGRRADEDEDEVIEEEEEEEDEEEVFDPSLPGPNSKQMKCLKMFFGHSGFKPVQWKVIHSVLQERRDNLVVMATGYGKSLCFQFPPVYCGGVGVVISPLIALMEDQVLQLQMSNIPACFLGSAQSENVFMDLKKGLFRVVYMTPEFCSGNAALLKQLDSDVGITLVAVDEAHCISEWGHDFRGAYRNLGFFKKVLPHVPIVALTATASPSIREDIVRSLHLDDPQVTCTSFDRPNLCLNVGHKTGNIFRDLQPFLIKKKASRYEFEGPSIIYCQSRKATEKVSAELSKLGISTGVYHAGMGIKSRRETHHKFMRDEIQCVVATVAFGMGINKADIRKVIHYGAPKEMESYYQEIGRAGRDGLPSACHVVWSSSDMALNRYLLNTVISDKHRGYKLKMMAKMEQYLNSPKCRRKLILSHFEDKQMRKATSGIMGTDRCCDNCRTRSAHNSTVEDNDPGLHDFGKEAAQLMGGIDALGGKFGVSVPILFLRGSSSQRLPARFRNHPLFGAGKNVSEPFWKALARALISEEYLKEGSGVHKFATICSLTPKGKRWLSKSSQTHQSLLLQPTTDLCARIFTVPRRSPAPPLTASPSASQSAAAQQKSKLSQFSQAETHTSPRTVSSPSKRPRAASVLKSPGKQPPSQPQPPAVSPRELELQGVLYGQLVAGRQRLASEKDIPPAVLATNKILLDMSKTRPTMVASLKMVDGVSEAKSAMLAPLLDTISSFCQSNGLKVNVLPGAPPCAEKSSPELRSLYTALPDSVKITYRLFQEQGLSVRTVCDSRSLPLAVVGSHLLQALKAGYRLDTERAGLTPQIQKTIANIIAAPPISSDLGNMKKIRELVPEEIDSHLIHLTVALLQKMGGAVPQAGKSERMPGQSLAWIQSKDQTVQRSAPPPAPAQPWEELEDMEAIEDALLGEIPMPDAEVTESLQSKAKSSRADGIPAQNPALHMASWNQKQLDDDTQQLFCDSPVKAVSQPVKRKVPEWFEVPKECKLPPAASKKDKRKKGLFS
ncbi:WRN helicase, partial [Amia calva]|nr:WRN helicase [Amia calva]